jgi:DNA-binding NtrC family response regulator
MCFRSWKDGDPAVCEIAASALGKLSDRQAVGLLISDFDMPGTNGVELFQQIRQVQPEIDGILVSGEKTASRRTAALDAGMLTAVHKLFDCSELLALIATTCRQAA